MNQPESNSTMSGDYSRNTEVTVTNETDEYMDEDTEEIFEVNTNNIPVSSNTSVFPTSETLRQPKFRPANPVLPETVTMIENTETGGRVYIVGTAHFGKNSQEDVATTIRMLKPDFVVLELCPERKAILTMDESVQQTDLTWNDFQEMIKRMGASQAVLQYSLLKLSAHCTKKLGMTPGGEMRCAYREAVRLQDAMIFLGDRPISITLKRAFGSLNFFQKLHFFWVLLREMRTDISQEDVEKCKSSDVVEELIEKLSEEFPSLHRVLVAERDIFLTHMLKMYTTKKILTSTGPQPSVVVGVVGIGHVPGIKKTWSNGLLTQEQIAHLLTIPSPSLPARCFSLVLKISFLGVIGFGAYKVGIAVYKKII